MSGLLKADFRRIFKDKLLLVMGILAVVFAIAFPLFYAGLFSLMGMTEEEMQILTEMGMAPSAKLLFFNAFSLSDNVGLIAPVLLAIALWKDFSFGTVRNKIIAGKSRSAIFMSLFITCAVVFVSVMLLHAFLTLAVSLLFFDYQAGSFALKDFWYLLESLVFEILILLYVAAMVSWLCASMKNIGLVIVLYIAFSVLLAITGGIIQGVTMGLEMVNEFSTTKISQHVIDLLHFLDRINVGMAPTFMAANTSYTWEDALYLTIPSLTGIASFLTLGLWRFNKKDLK